ncbi:MAG TPA: ABC-2 family transporter protein [Patescibacteria group bacterium]
MYKHWHLFWFFRKVSLMKLMEYRTDFYFWMTVSVMWTTFNFFFFSLLINLNGTIGGWSRWELYALLGVFTMLDAFTWSFMAQNMWSYTGQIFSGKLSGVLVKPIDAQFAMMATETSYNNIPRFLIGLAAVAWSLRQLGITPDSISIILFITTFFFALLFIYSLWFTVATLAFWVEKLDNINEIVPAFRRMWQVPRTVYIGLSSTLFTVVLPLGLVSSLPTEILLHQLSGAWLSYFIVFSCLTFLVSRVFFKYSVKKYSSVGG